MYPKDVQYNMDIMSLVKVLKWSQHLGGCLGTKEIFYKERRPFLSPNMAIFQVGGSNLIIYMTENFNATSYHFKTFVLK